MNNPDAVPALGPRTAVVTPCFREKAHILAVLAGIGPEVGDIIVVDDACPEGTGAHVEAECADSRVRVIRLDANQGVGAAVKAGYEAAKARGAEIIVKLDGDGQMDPALIPMLTAPVAAGLADYAKGDRFDDFRGLSKMPLSRLIGNIGLSFLTKLSSGYWHMFDPANGFTAVHVRALDVLDMDRIDNRFFFESDILHHLGLARAVVADVPMRARYGEESSHVSILRAGPEFLFKNLRNTVRRLALMYFVRDVSVASAELVLGVLALAFGVVFGLNAWAESNAAGVPATAGTVLLAGLPVIIGVQLLAAFFAYDTRRAPDIPIQRRPRRRPAG